MRTLKDQLIEFITALKDEHTTKKTGEPYKNFQDTVSTLKKFIKTLESGQDWTDTDSKTLEDLVELVKLRRKTLGFKESLYIDDFVPLVKDVRITHYRPEGFIISSPPSQKPEIREPKKEVDSKLWFEEEAGDRVYFAKDLKGIFEKLGPELNRKLSLKVGNCVVGGFDQFCAFYKNRPLKSSESLREIENMFCMVLFENWSMIETISRKQERVLKFFNFSMGREILDELEDEEGPFLPKWRMDNILFDFWRRFEILFESLDSSSQKSKKDF